jgi:hypothetical protein
MSSFAAAQEAGKTVDLTKLQTRIAATAKTGWTDEDTTQVETVATQLMAGLAKASGTEAKKLPVEFKGLTKVDPAQLKAVKNSLIIGEDIKANSATNCVIVASGNVQITKLTNCIVFGGEIRATNAENSLFVAKQYLRVTVMGRKGDECIAVAGERFRSTNMTGGYVYVLHPGTGSAPADDKDGDKPIRISKAQGVHFLGKVEKGPYADAQCKWFEVKTPLAK